MTVQTAAEAAPLLEKLIDAWVTDRFPGIDDTERAEMVGASPFLAEAITEAGYVVVPATDIDLLRRDVFRSMVGLSYAMAVASPLAAGLGTESQLRNAGQPLWLAASFGTILVLVLGFVFVSLAKAIKMFGDPSHKGARRIRERFEARVAHEQSQEAERLEKGRRRLVEQAAELERRMRPRRGP